MKSFDINNMNFMSSSLYRSYSDAKTPVKSITIIKNNLINRCAIKSVALDSRIVANLDNKKVTICSKE